MSNRQSIRAPKRRVRSGGSAAAETPLGYLVATRLIGALLGPVRGLARASLWLIECYRRSGDRHDLAQLDPRMRADLREDRVEAEIAKRPWQS
jgi:hypothetical protein